MYCTSFFDCKERADVDYCINFSPRDKDSERRYKEWRNEKENDARRNE